MNQEQEPLNGYGIKRYLQRRRLAATGMSFQIIINVGWQKYIYEYIVCILFWNIYNLNIILCFFPLSAMYLFWCGFCDKLQLIM